MNSAIPQPGQWVRTAHECWWKTGPSTIHNDPVRVTRVVKLGDGVHRIETTRCDGTAMHFFST